MQSDNGQAQILLRMILAEVPTLVIANAWIYRIRRAGIRGAFLLAASDFCKQTRQPLLLHGRRRGRNNYWTVRNKFRRCLALSQSRKSVQALVVMCCRPVASRNVAPASPLKRSQENSVLGEPGLS